MFTRARAELKELVLSWRKLKATTRRWLSGVTSFRPKNRDKSGVAKRCESSNYLISTCLPKKSKMTQLLARSFRFATQRGKRSKREVILGRKCDAEFTEVGVIQLAVAQV